MIQKWFCELAEGTFFGFPDSDDGYKRLKVAEFTYLVLYGDGTFEKFSINGLEPVVIQRDTKGETSEMVETNRWYENKNAEKVVNASGGMQSKLDCQWTRLDPNWLKDVGTVLTDAANKLDESGNIRYPDDPQTGTPNWHKISTKDHIEHVLEHAIALLGIMTAIQYEPGGISGVIRTEDYSAIQEHCAHLACRSMFAHNSIKREYLNQQYDG